MDIDIEQPKPDSSKFQELISNVERGDIKIPKFQRDFVWNVEETAKLLDSVLKGYPIGTFILWQTKELEKRGFNKENFDKVQKYRDAFNGYQFSLVLLKREDIDAEIEVFTCINMGGQPLSLFEIMSTRTYDETADFDMQEKWEGWPKM